MEYPFCSILVLNYNGKKYLKDCFQSIRELNYPKDKYEVIMIDNASADDSIEFVNKSFPEVKIVKLDQNYGFGGGYNRGLPTAKGEYFLILNNDTRVEKDWLIELVKVANSSKKIGICGSRISDKKIGNVGEGHINLLFGEASQKDNTISVECFWISDCSMLIKREVVNKMGKIYDDPFFMYFEEVDVCWRTRLLGYDVYYVPSSVVQHLGSSTSMSEEFIDGIMKYYHYRNKIWTFRKNSRSPLTQMFMIPIALTTSMMIVYWGLTGKMNFGISVLKHMFTKKDKNSVLRTISLKDQLKLLKK